VEDGRNRPFRAPSGPREGERGQASPRLVRCRGIFAPESDLVYEYSPEKYELLVAHYY